MISIELNNIGKKFKSEWVFRKLNYTINAGDTLVIKGGNGSGKSTLIQIISAYVNATEGTINYYYNNNEIALTTIHNHISFASPYLQLTEEFTLLELVNHYSKLKPFQNNITSQHFIDSVELTHATNKYISQFSSGMKQRLKLGLAILSKTDLLLLDEPISNLDRKAIDWYKNLIKNNITNRTVVVCSNAIEEEFWFCDKQFNLTNLT